MAIVVRNILAVLAGIIVGSVVNMSILGVGMMVIPPPEGADFSDPEKFAESLKLLRPIHFVTPWLAHAVGTFAGALCAALLAVRSKLAIALGIGAFFLLGGLAMVASVGGPIGFILLDLLVAYLPMGWLGYRLAVAIQRPPA